MAKIILFSILYYQFSILYFLNAHFTNILKESKYFFLPPREKSGEAWNFFQTPRPFFEFIPQIVRQRS
jgi:hypothetical protein